MRTTVRLDPGLLADAKRAALERRISLTALIEQSLRVALARQRQPRAKVLLPISDGGEGVQPGVDLNDSAALLDYMDEWGRRDRG